MPDDIVAQANEQISPSSDGAQETSAQGTAAQTATGTEQVNPASQANAQQEAKANPADVSMDKIIEAARGQRTLDEEVELLKKANSASQREGIRLNSVVEDVKKALDAQGIELVLDPKTKGFKALVAAKNYKGEVEIPSMSFDDLDESEQEQFSDDPKKAFNAIMRKYESRLKEATLRAKPTVDKLVEPVSESRLIATHEFLQSRKDAITGDPLYPDYEAMKPIISAFVSDEQSPKWLKEAVAENTSEAMPFVYAHLKLVKERLAAAAQKVAQTQKAKQEQGQHASLVQPSGSGTAVIKDGSPESAFLGTLRGNR